MNLVHIGMATAKYLGKTVINKVKDNYDGWLMRRRIDAGADLTIEGTLRTLVQSEIQKLAEKPGLLVATERSTIRDWISTQDFLDPFIWLLITTGNGLKDVRSQ